ncbi:MAG: hypothetical protein A4E63_03091 [Syntrophorhabdus sp. PtaU1.Bin050]|nr:MAG: hypothetical protein A4E63_03091 [Syntrophorhabdus sp. PtaU1.Bin050]
MFPQRSYPSVRIGSYFKICFSIVRNGNFYRLIDDFSRGIDFYERKQFLHVFGKNPYTAVAPVTVYAARIDGLMDEDAGYRSYQRMLAEGITAARRHDLIDPFSFECCLYLDRIRYIPCRVGFLPDNSKFPRCCLPVPGLILHSLADPYREGNEAACFKQIEGSVGYVNQNAVIQQSGDNLSCGNPEPSPWFWIFVHFKAILFRDILPVYPEPSPNKFKAVAFLHDVDRLSSDNHVCFDYSREHEEEGSEKDYDQEIYHAIPTILDRFLFFLSIIGPDDPESNI